ncbi:MAG: PAS domain-containing protein, partial [Haloarculaceae archaeon]
MMRRSRVVVVGDDAEWVAEALAEATDLSVEAGPVDEVTDEFAVVVWSDDDGGERAETATDALAGLCERIDAPVLVYSDGPPEAAFDAGAADFVRRGDGSEAVLAERVAALAMSTSAPAPAPAPASAPAADGGAQVEHHFRAIVEQVSDPIFLKDREGRYRFINEAGAAVFGRDVEDVLGRTDAELLDEQAAAEIRADDERVMETGESLTVEAAREYGADERVFETVKHPYRQDGEIRGVIGIARDVTEQRRTERELERNQRALRDLQRLATRHDVPFEQTLERALEVGRDRLDLPVAFLTRIDDGTQRIVAAVGDHEGLTPGDEAPLSESYCRKALEADGLLAVEHASEAGWADDPAYERFGLECYLGGKIEVDGAVYGTLCFADSERRERPFTEAEESFIELLVEWLSYEFERRERERDLEGYETIIRSVDDGVYELDADGRFTFVNPALAALTGYDRAELEGEHVSIVKSDDETAAALEALLDGEVDERTVEGPVQRKRGPPIICEDRMARLTDEDGTVRGVAGVVRDVTEQRAQREMLSDLLVSSRTLMQARDREEVAEMVAQAVASVLGFDLTVVRLFDRETETLEPAGTTDAVDERLSSVPTFDMDEGGPGHAFARGETVEVPDTADVDDEYDREVIRSALHLPMGVHGTISIGSTEPDGFSDVDRNAAELLATSAAA